MRWFLDFRCCIGILDRQDDGHEYIQLYMNEWDTSRAEALKILIHMMAQ